MSDLKKNLKEKKLFWNKSEKGESYIFATPLCFEGLQQQGQAEPDYESTTVV